MNDSGIDGSTDIGRMKLSNRNPISRKMKIVDSTIAPIMSFLRSSVSRASRSASKLIPGGSR
jgi:hypothetical protein